MPLVEISMLAGRSDEAKERLIREITETVVRAVEVPAEAVTVIIREVPRTQWGKAGEPYSKRRT